MCAMALTYPLGTLSTRSQVSKGTQKVSQWDTLQKILREEGIAGLYSGISSAMFGIAFTQYIYYYWYEAVKGAFEAAAGARALTVGENMLTGALAGAVTATLTNPIWVLNTRMVVKKEDGDGKPSKRGTLETAMKIFKEEGIQGFFQGLLPALILVINPVIQYTVFERLKGMWMARKAGAALSGLDFFLLGAVSKLCATTITYPYIVVKTRMQLKQTGEESTRYKSLLDGLIKIAKSEGLSGLYKGIESRVIQSVLMSAFLFAFKEELFGTSTWLLTLLRMREAKAAVASA